MSNLEDVDNNIKKLLIEFHKGLDFYHNQEWDEAIKCFSRANNFEEKYDGRKTNPSLVFIERSKRQRFETVAEKRLSNIEKSISTFNNFFSKTNVANYDFTKDDI